jgi:hypothetical protein
VVVTLVELVVPERAGCTPCHERLGEQGDRRSGSDAGPVPDPAGETFARLRCSVAGLGRAPYEKGALVTS